jgi:hypothetical protein
MSNDSLPRLFEGDFTGKAIKVEYGEGKGGKPSIRVTMEIGEGPRRGTQVQYEANMKAESIKYTKRDLMALGWQGKSVATLVDDITKAALVVPFSTRIATYENPETGKTRQWNSVGSIGNAAPPLSAPTQDTTRNVDNWFAEVDDVPGNGGGAGQSRGYGGHPNAPGSDENPF